MEHDEFDYDELRRSVDDLLSDELGSPKDDFPIFDDAFLADEPSDAGVVYHNAANRYGGYVPAEEPVSDYDEEADAMRYDPQTNSGAVIRAYNTDYASRAVQRAQRKGGHTPKPSAPSGDADATQQLPYVQQLRMQQPAPRRVRSYPVNRPEEVPAKKPKKKRHGFLKLLLWLLILLALAVLALWLFAKSPEGDSLGVHRDGCASILLAGTDAGGERTDTMMLLYVDEKAGELNLLSLPRDT